MATSRSWISGNEGFVSRRHFAHRKATGYPVANLNSAEPAPMPWSWHIARIAGIDVYIHATFLILIGWILMVYWAHGSSPVQTAIGVTFVLALFLCVVLHEFGHALTARRYGIHTRDITLLPIGGVARLERIPRVPYQELLVALAGPAVNLVIAAVLFAALAITRHSMADADVELIGSGSNPVASMMKINVMLAVFNMLPAFPMDGGRVLRALLAMWIPRVRATRIASVLGQAMAILFGIWGLFGQPFMLFIALFVFMGAMQEYQTTRFEAAVEGLRVHDAMMTSFRTLLSNDPLSRAVSLLLQSSQHDFPVLDGEFNVVGILLRQDLIAALSKDGGSQLPVSSAMRKVEISAKPDEALEPVFERMQSSQLPVLPVFGAEGRLVGLVTMENVAEVVLVQNAIEKSQER